ncbi:acyl-CoA dehydrogenase family protein [Micromonospora sp. NPDC002296]|uniref:acyl-CoA dehydrogenase family protein n=1 Tax=Micromonospora sp. NPDC002296 TaxID=3154271 RepID=UPI003334929C
MAAQLAKNTFPTVDAGLLTLVAEHADAAERARRLAPEVVAALVAAGFARHFVPRDLGGAAGSFADLHRAVAEVATVCPATAWCASINAHLARMAAFLPEEGRREVWHDGPDALVVGSLIPGSRAVPAADGWRLTGSWQYVSGVDHADWALLCGVGPAGEGATAMMFALPRASWTVLDTWSDVGMCGTGSHTLTVDDVFVPARRVFQRDLAIRGGGAGASAACLAVPLRAVNALSFAGPALGAARGLLEAWRGHVTAKLSRSPSGPVPHPYAAALARATGEIDAAELLLERACRTADTGEVPTVSEVRNLRDCALATDLLVTAADRLFRSAGTSAHSVDGPMQRYWRDLHSIASHVVLQFDAAATTYAEAVLGGAPAR